MELTPEIAFLVSVIITPIVAQGIKWVSAFLGWELGRRPISIVAFIESAILAVVLIRPTLPLFEDPMAFVLELLVVAGAVLGFAQLLYNLVLARLFELLGFVPVAAR